jgi:hypothetical protein
VLGGNRHAGIIVADTPRGSSTDVVVEGNELNGDDVRGL